MLRRTFCITLIASLVVLGASCKPRADANANANAKHYTVKGKVIAVDKTERTVTIDHEDIVGYMGAMTMEFDVKDDVGFPKLEAGDQVTATLAVTEEEDWLENLIITKPPVPDPNAKAGENAVEPSPGAETPDFALVNQDGKRIHLAQYKGKALALTFIYTRCPDANQCPLMSANFATINQTLQKEPEVYKKTHLLSVSFDPDYDTPKVLRSYGAGQTNRLSNETFEHWEFATGSKDEVKKIAEYFGLKYFKDESGTAKVIHSLRTAVIGPDGKLYKYYRGNEWKPEEIVSDLKSIVAK
ncbi:MAG TPA: SCO family protein [Pyrinomonadaceae bacterium]